MSIIIFGVITLLAFWLWGRPLLRLYNQIQRATTLTELEKRILSHQLIALSMMMITVFLLLMGDLFYHAVPFFDSGTSYTVILVIVDLTLSYMGLSAIKYRLFIAREPIRGKGAMLVGMIALVGMVLQTVFLFWMGFI